MLIFVPTPTVSLPVEPLIVKLSEPDVMFEPPKSILWSMLFFPSTCEFTIPVT